MFDIFYMEEFYMNARRERFIKIAENRTNKILETLRLLANCSNKSNYEYSEEDVYEIFSAIEKELKNTKAAFYGTTKNDTKFTLRRK